MPYRTYYRGPDAIVTDRLFVRRSTPARSLVLRELRSLRVSRVRGPRSVPVVVVASCVAAGAVLAGALLDHVWALWVSAAIAVVALGLSWIVVRRPATLTLRGLYQGAEMVIYTSTDQRIFNQICRAVRRAMEDIRPIEGLAEGRSEAGR